VVGVPMTPVHLLAAVVVLVPVVILCVVVTVGLCTHKDKRRKFATDALPSISSLVWRALLAVGGVGASAGAIAALEAIRG
jgi:hypothetical protein